MTTFFHSDTMMNYGIEVDEWESPFWIKVLSEEFADRPSTVEQDWIWIRLDAIADIAAHKITPNPPKNYKLWIHANGVQYRPTTRSLDYNDAMNAIHAIMQFTRVAVRG